MVITRAQSTAIFQARNTNMNVYSDNESDLSFSEINSDNLIAENSSHHFNEQQRDHERIRIERRFNDMNN